MTRKFKFKVTLSGQKSEVSEEVELDIPKNLSAAAEVKLINDAHEKWQRKIVYGSWNEIVK